MIKAEQVRRWALEQVGSAYIYGATGKKCTPRYRRELIKQYPGFGETIAQYCPVLSGKQDVCAVCRFDGEAAFDCAQLLRRGLEQVGIKLLSGSNSQWHRTDWEDTGPISTLPPGEVLPLYRVDERGIAQHTGICLGDGTVVDARGHSAGVLHRPLNSYRWTHWARPRGMGGVYVPGAKLEATVAPVLRVISGMPLMRGEQVRVVQERLIYLGFDVGDRGADGVYGYATQAAVVAWQRSRGLPATGEVGMRDIEALAQAPVAVKTYRVVIPGMTRVQRDALLKVYPQARAEEEGGN